MLKKHLGVLSKYYNKKKIKTILINQTINSTKMRTLLLLCFVISLLLLGIRAEDNDEITDTFENTDIYSKIGSIKLTLD